MKEVSDGDVTVNIGIFRPLNITFLRCTDSSRCLTSTSLRFYRSCFAHYRLFSVLHAEYPGRDVVFFKHMGKQLLPHSDWSWLRSCRNIILLRHPLPVLRSFHRAMVAPGHVASLRGLEDSGIASLLRIHSFCEALGPGPWRPQVVLNEDLLQRPEETLRRLCDELVRGGGVLCFPYLPSPTNTHTLSLSLPSPPLHPPMSEPSTAKSDRQADIPSSQL